MLVIPSPNRRLEEHRTIRLADDNAGDLTGGYILSDMMATVSVRRAAAETELTGGGASSSNPECDEHFRGVVCGSSGDAEFLAGLCDSNVE
ncbi:MAG TPA: hypothetical protein VF680_01725 [Allosphingosinicella sp.]